MKLILAGSRSVRRRRDIDEALLASGWAERITELVHGDADGADTFGRLWAEERGIPTRAFPYPSALGRKGGPIRNAKMADYVGPTGAVVVVWDGVSTGSASMMREATRVGMHLFVWPSTGCKDLLAVVNAYLGLPRHPLETTNVSGIDGAAARSDYATAELISPLFPDWTQ